MAYHAKTHVISINAQQPAAPIIAEAAAIIQAGGLVAFPTETVYGLGANALNEAAVQRIYSAKGRPANNPLIVHIATHEQLAAVAMNVPDVADPLIAAFWPGALTLVLERHAQLPDSVSLGRTTVAVRMPSHPVAQALLHAAGMPIVAPSANRFTRPSGTSAQHVYDDLAGHVDLILDAGPTPIGLESTVLDLTVSPPLVLRPGGITLEALQTVIPTIQQRHHHIEMDDQAARPASPGMLTKHYSPNATVLLFTGPFDAVTDQMQATAHEQLADGKTVGILTTDEDQAFFSDLDATVLSLGSQTDLAQIGRNLFAALRELDTRHVDVILVRQFAAEGLGVSIADRLLRAAEGQVIVVA